LLPHWSSLVVALIATVPSLVCQSSLQPDRSSSSSLILVAAGSFFFFFDNTFGSVLRLLRLFLLRRLSADPSLTSNRFHRHAADLLVLVDPIDAFFLFVNRHSLQPYRSPSLATRVDPIDTDCLVIHGLDHPVGRWG